MRRRRIPSCAAPGIFDVGIEHVVGQLSDHYDPRKKMLRLSDSVFDSTSIAALGVAAHEVGHAIQHHEGYLPLKLRNAIIPVTQIASNLSMPLIFLGSFWRRAGQYGFWVFLDSDGNSALWSGGGLSAHHPAGGIQCVQASHRHTGKQQSTAGGRDSAGETCFVSGGHDLRGSRGDSPCKFAQATIAFWQEKWQ